MSNTNPISLTSEITMESLPFHLQIAFETGNPLFIHGSPGIGKSSGVYDFCAKMHAAGTFQSNIPIDIRLGNHDITDFKFPLVDRATEKLKWIVADIFPTQERDGEAGVLFLDELPSAPTQIQTLAYALLQDRKIPSTNYVLPPKWVVVAAGNLETDQAVVHKLSSALCNRINHLFIRPDWPAFRTWGETNNICPFVLQFLDARHSDYLYKYSRGDKAYPSPRSWHKASDALKILLAGKQPLFRIQEQMVSWLGAEVGNAFTAFIDSFSNLPDPKAVLEGKSKLPPIDEIDKLFFLGKSLAETLKSNPNKYAKQYLAIIVDELNEEIAVDSLRITLSDEAKKTKVMEAFRKEATAFTKVVQRYGPALSKLGLES